MNRIITSDNPAYETVDENGNKVPIFVATPKVLIMLAKKDPLEPNAYKIKLMDQQEVEYYNNKTFEQASFIISKKELNIPQYYRDVTSLKISPARKAEFYC